MATADAYVSLEDRRRFIDAVAGLIEATERAHAAPQTRRTRCCADERGTIMSVS
jgi:hypothetical protein